MYIFRFHKRAILGFLLFVQFILIASYFYLHGSTSFKEQNNEYITFVTADIRVDTKNATYHRENDSLFLKSVTTNSRYKDFNSSLCYRDGTDLKAMKRTKNLNWKCECNDLWHGNDCGQPEVIWRALLNYRKTLHIKGPRLIKRRLLYILKVDKLTTDWVEIQVNELNNIVELFVLYEEEGESFLSSQLEKGFLQKHHQKILYLSDKNLWHKVKKTVKNLRESDIVICTKSNEFLNKLALNFLKYYDNWPEPVEFRLRWTSFGFFWMHPNKTIIKRGLSTVQYLDEFLDGNLNLAGARNTNHFQRGIVLGDLNHIGGWFCEFCLTPPDVVEFLSSNQPLIRLKWKNQVIDTNFIEELVENGIYIDGKTELTKIRKYQDKYFAPEYVMEHNVNFDFLLQNLYSKMDYYEG